jgi:tetratricopeptide (TPR) repeat protein
MADRYTYLPQIGLFVMLCWSVPERASKPLVCAVAATALAACGVLSRVQLSHWKNSETLFGHTLKVTKDNWLAHVNLGAALMEAGRGREEEMEQYRQALRIKPSCAEAHYNLAGALWEDGQQEEAIGHWQEAVRIQPQYADAHGDLGDAFRQLGNLPEAVRHYEQAWRIKPARAEAYNDLGAALWQAGEAQRAIRFYEQALQMKPDYAEAHYNLAGALEQQGRLPEAIMHYEQALRIRPGFVEAQNRLERLRAGP